jgi:sensor histidine kinase YesM
VFHHKFRYAFVALLSGYSFLNIILTIGTSFINLTISNVALFFLITAEVLGVWEMNRWADKFLKNIGAARKLKVHHLVILFTMSLAGVAVITFVNLQGLYLVMNNPRAVAFENFKLLFALGLRVNLFLHCINAIVFFINKYKESQLEAERLKKDTIEAQFEALRAQINPHFLFNCLNVLSSLVFKDADTSARFIGQLSNVYRYLLFSQEKKVVPLGEEIAFLQSYIFLLKIRFGENVIFNAHLPNVSGYYVAPAVLQMLIENAIKHNVVSAKNPLKVNLSTTDTQIEISNSLNEKSVKEESARVGLRNIRDRYKLLSEIPVEIEKSDGWFRVRVPLLRIESL